MKNDHSKSCAICLFVLASMLGFQSHAEEITPLSRKNIKALSEVQINERVEILTSRINSLNAMDLSSMTRAEKKEIKKELRDIQKEHKTLAGTGVYLSVGAIIIILLLLILLV